VLTLGPNPLSSLGYDHLGDLDQVGGFLFVPVEDTSHTLPPAIAVFEASDLTFVGLKVTSQANAGWVAFNSDQDLLYSSDSNVSHTDPLYRYNVDLNKLATTGDVAGSITLQDRFDLLEADGSELSHQLVTMQGGTFTPQGDLYVVNGNHESDLSTQRGGIHLFGADGRLIAESTNDSGTGAFDYAYDPGLDQEPEGIDYWNRDVGPASPGIGGQLHAMLHEDNFFTADHLFFKHYDVNYLCDANITASGQGVAATEGSPFSGQVASFTDPDTSASASEYIATVDWGDGTGATTGTIAGSGGSFTIGGSHTYADEGSYTVSVTITDTDTPSNTATVTSTATAADAALASAGTSPVSAQSFNGTIATFTDGDTSSTPADFTATIDWGDGSPTSTGTVSGGGGNYSVAGSHAFTGTGNFTVKVHIADDGGSTTDATSKLLTYGYTTGGNFVIGDKSSGVSNRVYFWGSRWASMNGLSGGGAPSGFKGWENSPNTHPVCGETWNTTTGNSPPPPSGTLHPYIAVIVASKVRQPNSMPTGNAVHVVVVKTNSGYTPDPSTPGTGTEVAIVC
jgi:hypothetical protein